MIKKTINIFMILCIWGLLPLLSVAAQGLAGNSYYITAFDLQESSVENFTLTFSDNETGDSTDNATGEGNDNATAGGSISISQEGTTFESSSGSYLAGAILFNASWEATEKKFSSFYEEDIYTYYSYLFFGITFANDFITAGYIYCNRTTESTSKGREEFISIMPFVGVLISASDAGRIDADQRLKEPPVLLSAAQRSSAARRIRIPFV